MLCSLTGICTYACTRTYTRACLNECMMLACTQLFVPYIYYVMEVTHGRASVTLADSVDRKQRQVFKLLGSSHS